MRSWLTIAAFAAAMGHLLWQTSLGPKPPHGYFVGDDGPVPVLLAPEPGARQLYLRREIRVGQQPQHAWIRILARDQIELFINGKLVQRARLDGFPVAIVADLSTYLLPGINVIAIHARQAHVDYPPAVSVLGSYRLSDGDHPIGVDGEWRSNVVQVRNGAWWFAPIFDDRHWTFAPVGEARLRAQVKYPPRSISEPAFGDPISPTEFERGRSCIRREFQVSGRPSEAWVRVTTKNSYRLAINGVVVDQQEDQLGVNALTLPARRIYDIAPFLRSGQNVVAMAFVDEMHLPMARIDGEIRNASGETTPIDSGDGWLAAPGLPAGWHEVGTAAHWKPCDPARGNLDMHPWKARSQFIEATLGPWQKAADLVRQTLLMVILALATRVACVQVATRLPGESIDLATLALFAPTFGVAAAIFSAGDPRVEPDHIFRWLTVFGALAAVAAQWIVFARIDLRSHAIDWSSLLRPALSRRRLVIGGYLALLIATGFCLRVRDIWLEPLQWDEVENYYATLGTLKRGFPNVDVHPDLPIAWTHTSELEFYAHAITALFSNDSYIIMRLPTVFFSALTIGMVFLAGRRLFNTSVGLLAATLIAFAPSCVMMSTIGRYFSQLQFFTVLTVYFLWGAVRGAGPVRARGIWLTAFSFLGMFGSWEASALIAPGLAIGALFLRRGRTATIFAQPAVYGAGALVLLILVLQRSHATLSQMQFLWYGVSLSDIRLIPMWNSQAFQPWYYIWVSSWSQDLLIPILGMIGAIILAVRGPFARQTRLLLIVHLSACLLMGFLLPTCQFRYVHHLIPLPVLLASAAMVALVRAATRTVDRLGVAAPFRLHARAVGAAALAVFFVVGNGWTFEMRNFENFRVEGMPPRVFKYPDIGGPARFVRDHMRQGDIVLANHVYQVNHLMGLKNMTDPETRFTVSTGALFLPATITDTDGIIVDRRDGTRMLTGQAQLEDLFARKSRIWYIVQPGQHAGVNQPAASAYLRRHMQVVYEDYDMLVLFWGDEHRPAEVRQRDDDELQAARVDYLP